MHAPVLAGTIHTPKDLPLWPAHASTVDPMHTHIESTSVTSFSHSSLLARCVRVYVLVAAGKDGCMIVLVYLRLFLFLFGGSLDADVLHDSLSSLVDRQHFPFLSPFSSP